MVGTKGMLTNTNPPNGANSTNIGTLDDQTKAFIQQLIDSAMAGIQSSFQDALQQVVLQQDYLKVDVQQLKNGEGSSSGGSRLQFGRITKLEFPKFFSVEHVDDANKVKLASIHFFDSALVWHQQFEKLNGNLVSWEDYQKALLATFDTDFEDPLSELKNLKCDSTVQKYHEKFEFLLNKVEMPEAHAISLFLGGMPQSVSLPVRMFKPKSLSHTASLCKLQEATIATHKASICLKRSLMTKGPRDCVSTNEKFVPGHKCSGQDFALELVIDPESYRTIRVIGHFGRQRIHIPIGSGSTHNFLDVYMAKKLGCKITLIDPLQVSVADGNKITSRSMCKNFSWMLNGERFSTVVMLLPLGGCEMFQHEGRHVALRGTTKSPMQWFSRKQLTKHVTQKAYVFSLPTTLPPQRHHDHRIPLKEGSIPVNIRPYKHPPSQKDTIESMVQELLDSKVIRPSNSPFSSPIVMVKKKDGTWRMCIDYTQLNKLTIKDKFPIPLIEELIDELNGSKGFSKLDLRKFTLVFFDDILVYSANVTEHLLHLSHLISENGVATDLVKILAMREWPNSTTLKQLRGFIGLTGTHAIIGAVLQQEGHHVAYLSKTLALKHQPAYEKELLAVIMALDRCRGYLLDRHFQIKTNHFSLKYFLDQRITTPFQSKWLPKLLGFDYEIMYKRGKENDALSRTAHGGELSTMAIEQKRKAYGIVATTQRLGKWFYWKGLRKTVKKLVIQCDVYQRNKGDLAAYPGCYTSASSEGCVWPNTPEYVTYEARECRVEEVDRTLVAREQAIQLLEFHLKRAQNWMKSMADKQTFDREFNEGDWIGKVAYKLELQSIAQVNDVFHVSQLKKCKEEVVTTVGSFNQCRDDGLIDVAPMAVLDKRMVKKKNRVVVQLLVQ
ncbi:reverse transcriptase [Tanacetum coccineum]